MYQLLNFIKEWLPSIAVLIAGGWMLFQWVYGERLRQKKEGAAIDGKLSAKAIPFGSGQMLVSVEAAWNNRSPLPLYLDIHQCRIDIFKIPASLGLSNCSLTLKSDLGDPVVSHKFLLQMVEVDYYLEPATESTIVNHFILDKGIYGIRMVLHTGVKGGQWWKEIILDISKDAEE